jgi:hypothetical protein
MESDTRQADLPDSNLLLILELAANTYYYFAMRRLLGLLCVATTIRALNQEPLKQDTRPNIIVVLTDDQDLRMDSISYMPLLKKHIINHGTFYKHHYCSTAICCPSRITLWTGRNAHNTNVTDVFPLTVSPPLILQRRKVTSIPVCRKMIGTLTLNILKSVGTLISSINFYKLCSVATSGHSEPLSLEITFTSSLLRLIAKSLLL